MKKGLSLNKSFLNNISQLIKKGRSFVVSRPGTVNASLIKPFPLKTDTGEQMVTKFLLSKFKNNILWDARKVSSAKTSFKGLPSVSTMIYEVIPCSTQSSGELAHAVKNILPESPHLKIINNKNIIVLPQKEGSWKPKIISSARINRLRGVK